MLLISDGDAKNQFCTTARDHLPLEGDNDPLDVIEFGTRQLATGSVTPVKVLGVLALLDSGETDWKILVMLCLSLSLRFHLLVHVHLNI